ncbi:hypothetical protein FRC11_002843, partial [Ceratobasidium sp. 423]
ANMEKKMEVKAAIYPNAEGWPMFPRMDIIKVSQDDERMLFRRYFNLTSLASGGTTPAWTRIAQEGDTNPSVLPSRMPDDMPRLGNIKNWKRPEMNQMRRHLIDGQLNLLPEDKPIILDERLKQPVSGIRLPWTSAELAYSTWVLNTRKPEGANAKGESMSLPPARTTHVYAPFNLSVFQDLEDLHENDTIFFQLILDVARIEKLGPIHCSQGLVELCGHANPHLPAGNSPSIIESDEINEWFPNDFFNTNSDCDSKWNIQHFREWLKIPNAYTHGPTGTVYTGPLGVRNIVFALSRMKRVLDWVEQNIDVPTRIRKLMKGAQPVFDKRKANRTWEECVQDVSSELEKSRRILAQSFDERAAEFEDGVLRLAGHPDIPATKDQGISVTSGIPNNSVTLAAMALAIKRVREERDNEIEDNEVSMIAADRTDIIDEDDLEDNS